MADSDQIRQQRRRLHASGDHALCRPDRCPDAPGDDGHEIEEALLGLAATLDFDVGDPRAVLVKVAHRLAQGLDRQPTGALAGELRACLAQLAEDPNAPADRVDELRARRAVRRVRMLMGDAWAAEGNGDDMAG
jgi:hypothetical protein